MSDIVTQDFAQSSTADASARRALILFGRAKDAQALQKRLAQHGYQTSTTTTATALLTIFEFAPDVIIIDLQHADVVGKTDRLALARRLRGEPATYALPIVFVFDEDESAMRNAALSIGADDYLPSSSPVPEMLARLDALFWRAEAGRRATAVLGDQRLEIDNFMLVLDAVREELRAGAFGTLALVYAVACKGDQSLDKAARDRTLVEAHGYLKLQLRRIDAVAFYGPATLLIFLRRMEATIATATLTRLRREFLAERTGSDIAIGLASFPADGKDIESLIEKAEQAASVAHTKDSRHGVVAYAAKEEANAPAQAVASDAVAPALKPQPEAKAESITAAAQPIQKESFIDSRCVQEAKTTDPIEVVIATPVAQSATKPHGVKAARRETALVSATAHERLAGGALMPRRLLLTVSDAARMAQLNSLIRSAGYEARAAFNGQQALDLLRIERPDLLLLDYELHGMDGLETLRRLRKQTGGSLALPVILLAPSGSESARQDALELGAHAVVMMPYDPLLLLESVRAATSVD